MIPLRANLPHLVALGTLGHQRLRKLGELLEWLLEDSVADAAHLDLRMGDERFADGERPLVLCDTSGQLLEMPAGLAGDY